MKNEKTPATRDSILRLLSAQEVALLSNMETVPSLDMGDEYVDLEHPEQGVQTVHALTRLGVGRALPRSGVQKETWMQILAHLSSAE